jgi:hypothetical protein
MKWYEKSYRRCLVDMHIEDWDEDFLSKLDPETYVANMKRANVQSAMIYANSHVGCCYWPTKSGEMHKGIRGRDILGELLDLCRKEKMDTIVYYSLVYNNRAYELHPEWRIRNVDGKASRDPGVQNFFMKGRYGVCCPNNTGYRAFVESQVDELCSGYQFEGMFFDMTYWPAVCYCDACRKRYAEEVGGDMPEIMDWTDALWLQFQKKREEWICEFAHTVTAMVKERCPEVSIEHTCATVHFPYLTATTDGNSEANDYAGGDFYGGFLQQSFICKLYSSLTRNQPFEYMTSRCYPSLRDHTTLKTKEMLALHGFLALAHNGAFLAIDAIDPDGSLNEEVYRLVGEVFTATETYEKELGGTLCADVAVYFSLTSKYYPQDNGKHIRDTKEISDTSTDLTYLDAPVGAARMLKEAHIPFAVIARPNLETLGNYQVVILSGATQMDDAEVAAFRKFVEKGGHLYLSGSISPKLLDAVFGIRIVGETQETITYVAPTGEGIALLPHVSPKYPLTVFDSLPLAETGDDAEVLAQIVLPGSDPQSAEPFVSIHSNPPVKMTEHPALVKKAFGAGQIVWSAASLEAAEQPPHQLAFERIIKAQLKRPVAFATNAHPSVELVLFDQPDRSRSLLSLVNTQEALPPIPIAGIKVSIALNGKRPVSVVRLPDRQPIAFRTEGDGVVFMTDLQGMFEMIAIETK